MTTKRVLSLSAMMLGMSLAASALPAQSAPAQNISGQWAKPRPSSCNKVEVGEMAQESPVIFYGNFGGVVQISVEGGHPQMYNTIRMKTPIKGKEFPLVAFVPAEEGRKLSPNDSYVVFAEELKKIKGGALVEIKDCGGIYSLAEMNDEELSVLEDSYDDKTAKNTYIKLVPKAPKPPAAHGGGHGGGHGG